MTAPLRYDGEVALIAGGGGSLGGAYARLFAARGARVIVNDVSEKARTVADAINAAGGEAFAIVASALTDADAIVAEAIDRFGRLDILVNTQGLTGGGEFHAMPPAEWDRVFQSHFTSTLALSRAAWLHLVASGNGRLINTASTAMFGAARNSTYVSTKAAIFAASRCWAMEGAAHNVRVNVVLPTAISQMTEQIPDKDFVALLDREFQPERVAGLVGYLAHRDTTITCCALEAGGGRCAPVFLAEAASFHVDNAALPESWAGHDPEMLSRTPRYMPYSMMEELEARLRDMGPSFGEASGVRSDAEWADNRRRAERPPPGVCQPTWNAVSLLPSRSRK